MECLLDVFIYNNISIFNANNWLLFKQEGI
jgi:hypothetical protein